MLGAVSTAWTHSAKSTSRTGEASKKLPKYHSTHEEELLEVGQCCGTGQEELNENRNLIKSGQSRTGAGETQAVQPPGPWCLAEFISDKPRWKKKNW